MKKGQILEGKICEILFPNKGVTIVEGEEKQVIVKDGIAGQRVRFSVNKIRKGKAEGRILEILEKSPLEIASRCPHFAGCGGCTYQNLPYEEQLAMKARQVQKLLDDVCPEYVFEGILGSPEQFGYRNKMEFSFGDEYFDGPLALGMHKRGSFYDIVTVSECQIVDADFRKILVCVLDYFKEKQIPFYHKLRHTGYLRHLLVRKAKKTGEILIDLVTTSQKEWMVAEDGRQEEKAVEDNAVKGNAEKDNVVKDNAVQAEEREGSGKSEEKLLQGLMERLCCLPLEGTIAGILHTVNDSLADVIRNDRTDILYGKDFFYEELLGLRFKISPFSFFQTNSLGAEMLYDKARSYVGETKDKMIFDLYSGTGTIAQILAPVAKKVVGIEIVEEAVEAAKENAAANGLDNCEFLAGDVLKVIDSVEEKPDIIVLDPPRDGIHPKALEKIIAFGVDKIVYISCKPTSLARDLVELQKYGYQVGRVCCVDMFPGSVHVETVVLMSKVNPNK